MWDANTVTEDFLSGQFSFFAFYDHDVRNNILTDNITYVDLWT